eukprot:GFYU01000422.1.p1 GENE.GFYU01000422.1~~GFYU01000422.1.p1  ORF type:complete len:414 (+),score=90.45 GFYU01000422.1:51-1244(+)
MPINLEEIQAATRGLKKCSIEADFSKPKIDGIISEEEVHAFVSKTLSYNFEHWYEAIKDITFDTLMIPLTVDDAHKMREAYEERVIQKRESFSSDVQDAIADIEGRLDQAIDKIAPNGEGVFIKTSCRSPKDAPAAGNVRMRTKQCYKEVATAITQRNGGDTLTMDEKIECLLRASTDLLRVERSHEMMELMVSSERVYQDLLGFIEHLSEGEQTNFIIRKWVPLDVDMEFRCFVNKNVMTGMAQYNWGCVFGRLCEPALNTEILDTLKTFFHREVAQRATGLFADDAYVVDFAVTLKDSEGGASGSSSLRVDQVYVIEINPYQDTTDSAMFDWKKDEAVLKWDLDKCEESERESVAKAGISPLFEFRYRDDPKATNMTWMSHDWRDIITESDSELQ